MTTFSPNYIAWVSLLKEMEAKDIYMQAACKENEQSQDGQFGGVFTNKYLNICINGTCESSLGSFGSFCFVAGAIVSSFVATGLWVIKDFAIKGLYNAATATFTPVCYQPGSETLRLGSTLVKGYKYDLHMDMMNDWFEMNRNETGTTVFKYGTFGTYKNV